MSTITERDANGDATVRAWTQGMPATAGRYYVAHTGPTTNTSGEVEINGDVAWLYLVGSEQYLTAEEVTGYLFSPIADPPPLPEGWGA